MNCMNCNWVLFGAQFECSRLPMRMYHQILYHMVYAFGSLYMQGLLLTFCQYGDGIGSFDVMFTARPTHIIYLSTVDMAPCIYTVFR